MPLWHKGTQQTNRLFPLCSNSDKFTQENLLHARALLAAFALESFNLGADQEATFAGQMAAHKCTQPRCSV
ncbi:hypothetical protein AGR4A_Lc10045 [Agrobacterium tumefaciens str. B6]|uniref:Uncharacterized protein n=1 Tax=Agrobacterium tumefaciens str. B6 TaxID=1183423 RepID=A0A822V6D2_AGRTU|nr:hypothetical protein AGR4A_Lc10045 [Agrobacterium tumefaciens str. B6]